MLLWWKSPPPTENSAWVWHHSQFQRLPPLETHSLFSPLHSPLMHSSSPPSHSPHYLSHFGQTNACRPVSPERCQSAGCSDSLEDPHRCSPPCCRSERRRTERWREREREREWKRDRERQRVGERDTCHIRFSRSFLFCTDSVSFCSKTNTRKAVFKPSSCSFL